METLTFTDTHVMVPRTNLRAGDKGTRVCSGRGQREELHGDGGGDPRTHTYEVSRERHAKTQSEPRGLASATLALNLSQRWFLSGARLSHRHYD
jgi:hypothetical protein